MAGRVFSRALLQSWRLQMGRHRNIDSCLYSVPRVPTTRSLSAAATDPLPVPPADGTPPVYSEKISGLVKDISNLTLSEVAQLNDLLKSTLNIADVPVMSAGPVQSSDTSTAQESDEAQEEQTKFSVKLVSFSADTKVKLIKEVKTMMEGMNLVQAKKFVESAPQLVKENLSKEDAKGMKAALEAVGGTVEIE